MYIFVHFYIVLFIHSYIIINTNPKGYLLFARLSPNLEAMSAIMSVIKSANDCRESAIKDVKLNKMPPANFTIVIIKFIAIVSSNILFSFFT